MRVLISCKCSFSISNSKMLRFSWDCLSIMSATVLLISVSDYRVFLFYCIFSWYWQLVSMHLFSFYQDCYTFLPSQERCLRYNQISASSVARLLRLLLSSSLKFRSFSSYISRVDFCLSIFFSYSLSYSPILAIWSCTPMHQQLLRLNSSLTFLHFYWLARSFSSISFSYSPFQKALRSQKEDFYKRGPSFAESSLMLASSSPTRSFFVCSYQLAVSIYYLRPFTIYLSFLNYSKNLSNYYSYLYFLWNSACNASHFCCSSSTLASQCSLSFLSIMILLRYSASTIENLSSMSERD